MEHSDSVVKSQLTMAQAVEKMKAFRARKAMELSDPVVKSPLAKALEKLKASREYMEGIEYVYRGDYYDVVLKGPFINKKGLFGVVLRESSLKEDMIVFSEVPPITVAIPKKMFGYSNLQGLKDLVAHIMKLVVQTIREAPKEIHAAYRKAFYKAMEEYNERLKNKPAGQVDDPDVETKEQAQMIRDKVLKSAQIKADQMIRDEQIRADQIRASYRKAYADVRNQTGQVDPHNVDLAVMLSVKGTFEESDIEKQISNRQALVELKAKKCIAAAHVRADNRINCVKLLRASKGEKYERYVRNPGELREKMEAMLGFKDNLSP